MNPALPEERRVRNELQEAVRGLDRLRGTTPKKSNRAKGQFAIREIARRLATHGWLVSAEIPGYDHELPIGLSEPNHKFDILAARDSDLAVIEVTTTSITVAARRALARRAAAASTFGAVLLVYDAAAGDFVDWRVPDE